MGFVKWDPRTPPRAARPIDISDNSLLLGSGIRYHEKVQTSGDALHRPYFHPHALKLRPSAAHVQNYRSFAVTHPAGSTKAEK